MTAESTATDVLSRFHPILADWFRRSFAAPTQAQALAWPLLLERRSTLVAAPTGSGKTLTAFLAAIDELLREGLARGGALPDETVVVYVSPLKALSNDIRTNLQAPLAALQEALAANGLPGLEIRAAVRTGDTSEPQRQAMRKRAPHILVTTPESLYVLLGSDSGRRMLATTRTVIVDEIHAIAGAKRGSHLALSLERLQALCAHALLRIGLSATQKPIEAVADFLVGRCPSHDAGEAGAQHIERRCAIVDVGHVRERDLAIEVPPLPLEAIMANDAWERVYDRVAELVASHRTTLVFVNTRRMAERAARHLSDRLGKTAVAAHHGSLAKEQRLDAEQRLKRGELRVLVATASLELGIDIGDVELVCQLGSPRAIAPFLQRVGRSGHQVDGTPKGRLFPTSRDDLLECAALLDCVRRGELDRLSIPQAPLDVLAQQIIAEVSCREWHEDALFALVRRAAPYAALERERYDALLFMLAAGYASRQGNRAAYLHRDAVNGTLRARRGAKLTAVTSGGTIPENADYTVLLEPQGLNIGTVNEDFAVESLAGDVFQLGNASYRILRIESGRVRVEDAHGQPPNIPFWLGEAPGRSDELSAGVARLRERVDALLQRFVPAPAATPATVRLAEADTADADADAGERARALEPVIALLADELQLDDAAGRQIVEYLARTRAALGAIPTQNTLVIERFFDESGGMQLVLHSPFGSRINRAWGLALRKRLCRTFNFELQAAATEDAIVFSLSTSHSFVLSDVWRYLRAETAEHVLIQALLDAPLFNVRWRWNASVALALPRYSGGRKLAPQIQRMRSDDLLASVFPEQAACLENVVGERELPRHPLVEQTVDDCLHEAMDTRGWLELLRRIESGRMTLLTRDLPAPSPLAAEILNARPYAFLDDAPIEERRTQAVQNRRWSEPSAADQMGRLDAAAIESVREQAWPLVRDVDEMHEALMSLGCVSQAEAEAADSHRGPHGWCDWLQVLAAGARATRMQVGPERALWVPAERLQCLRVLYPGAPCEPAVKAPKGYTEAWDADEALVELLRARLSGFGPLPVSTIAEALALAPARVSSGLARLEAQGYVLRGRFTPGAEEEEWCERHLLARIHRYTVAHLRREIDPVERQDFMRFLFDWQRLSAATRGEGRAALSQVIEQLQGYPAAASAWEDDILQARLRDYSPAWLDELCRAGKTLWCRLPVQAKRVMGGGTHRATNGTKSAANGDPPAARGGAPVRSTPIVLLSRRELGAWQALLGPPQATQLSARAESVKALLLREGAMFFDELQAELRLLRTELENALGELVNAGWVNADSFAGLRALLRPAAQRGARGARRAASAAWLAGVEDAGRWSLMRRPSLDSDAGTVEAAPILAAKPAANGMPHAVPARRRATPEALEHLVMVLLRRYGVLFWHLLEREADWLPPWRELLPTLHRLEARGQIRGGRFVNALSGEQFALPEAIPLLRAVRRRALDGEWICVCGTDPLNVVGGVLPGDKVPALAGNRVLYRDGLPLASMVGGKLLFAAELRGASLEAARQALVRRH